MDKKEAAEFLGVTTRSIENYAKQGKLSVTYVPIKNGGKRSDYSEPELLALKEELEAVVHRSIVTPNTSEIQDSGAIGGQEIQLQLLQLIATVVIKQSLTQKITLSLDEAAEVSGLTRSHLLSAVKSGALNAKKIGRGWRVRRVDLDDYINKLFSPLPDHKLIISGEHPGV